MSAIHNATSIGDFCPKLSGCSPVINSSDSTFTIIIFGSLLGSPLNRGILLDIKYLGNIPVELAKLRENR
ncbi:hypothetical protein WN55_01281 [Dufourea novaeangliae]|uniref:Uncharacterized protein n=1 Tax=Dufourea novaeangliae TaxID=178035 RepID=A0A154NYS2_DUFNO|nr:hypothetical protein WN55_01281 [Dufourea novaeangliae]